MKLHIGATHVHLIGTGREFGEIIGLPEGNAGEIRKALDELIKDSGLDLSSVGRTLTLRGTWREFSNFIGFPEAANLSEFSMAFKKLHPEVEITLAQPGSSR